MHQNRLERATGSTLMRRLPRWESFWVLESLRVAESLLALECRRPSPPNHFAFGDDYRVEPSTSMVSRSRPGLEILWAPSLHHRRRD